MQIAQILRFVVDRELDGPVVTLETAVSQNLRGRSRDYEFGLSAMRAHWQSGLATYSPCS